MVRSRGISRIERAIICTTRTVSREFNCRSRVEDQHANVLIHRKSAIIPRPDGKIHRLPTPPENSKTQNKHNHLRPAVQRRAHQVVVLDEQLRVLLAEPPLRDEAQDEVDQDGRIDPNEQVAHVPQDDGQVDVLEEADLGVTVDEPEGDGDQEAEEVGDRDPLVAGADGEHLARDTPGDGEGVVLLDVLAGPDLEGGVSGVSWGRFFYSCGDSGTYIGSFNGCEDVTLVCDDVAHHNVIEDGTDDAAQHLSCKGTSRG